MWFPTVAGGRSKPYQGRYLAPDWRELTRPFRRKLDAERWLIEKERDKARGDLGRRRAGADGVFTEMARKVEATRLNRRPSSRVRNQSLLSKDWTKLRQTPCIRPSPDLLWRLPRG